MAWILFAPKVLRVTVAPYPSFLLWDTVQSAREGQYKSHISVSVARNPDGDTIE
jgi:hypothetical protein